MKSHPSASTVFKSPIHILAFGFGSGLIRPAPGTWGTLAAVPLFYLAATFCSLPVLSLITILLCFLSIYISGKSSQLLGLHDYDGIVIDEWAGLFLALVWFDPTLSNIVVGTLFFRFFDILKPWPIKWADQKVDGGLGITLDDLIAGLFAALSLYLVQLFGVL